MAYLRATVWGPAEFVGLPPGGWSGRGFWPAASASRAIVGTARLRCLDRGAPLADGEAGLVCARGARRVSVRRAGGTGAGRHRRRCSVCASRCRPRRPPAGVVLAERGRVQSVVVTSVEDGRAVRGGRGRYLCSVADSDGVPLKVRIWRGCGAGHPARGRARRRVRPAGTGASARCRRRGSGGGAAARPGRAGRQPSSPGWWSPSSAPTGSPSAGRDRARQGRRRPPLISRPTGLGVGEAVLMSQVGAGGEDDDGGAGLGRRAG